LHEVEEEAVLAFNSLRQDCETVTDSSQHFFDKWWHAECKTDRLKVENAKLRELVAKYSAAAKYLCGHSHCNECNLDCASVFDDVPSGWDCARMLLDKKARELGIEVE
jgi:hypothetical protein